jgi:dihydroorotate dehydrogenase
LVLSLDALHKSLLRLEPEVAHDLAIGALRVAQYAGLPLSSLRRRCVVTDPRLEQDLLGQRFHNPVGLAAGFDKNAEVVQGMAALGFGYLEVGTVTPMPQRGNPKPRVFRHPEQQSLQNALGFNNRGGRAMAKELRRQRPYPVPVGVNIGKNRKTSTRQAQEDYFELVEDLAGLSDYLVINVSSPNTPGLRDMQRVETVVGLLSGCLERTGKPILVKLAPDLEDGEAVLLAQAVVDAGAAGLVMTNTTIDYSLLPGADPRGGLSGKVLKQRSFDMLRLVASSLGGRGCLISVGGVDSAEEVYARLKHGASLVQVYTAMVFQGPLLISRLVKGLLELMERDGVERLEDLVGVEL